MSWNSYKHFSHWSQKLPRNLTLALHLRYRVDFLMFNYSLTEYLAPYWLHSIVTAMIYIAGICRPVRRFMNVYVIKLGCKLLMDVYLLILNLLVNLRYIRNHKSDVQSLSYHHHVSSPYGCSDAMICHCFHSIYCLAHCSYNKPV